MHSIHSKLCCDIGWVPFQQVPVFFFYNLLQNHETMNGVGTFHLSLVDEQREEGRSFRGGRIK